jgi:quinol monooxygenase YgiN
VYKQIAGPVKGVVGDRLPGVVVIHSGIMAQPLLTIFAEMYAKPGKEAALREVLLGLIEPTKKEAGHVQYDLHVDNDDPKHFLFYENWTSRAHLDAHLAAPHLQAFLARQDELLAAPVRIVFATRQA